MNDETEYVAVGPHAWGRGAFQTDAVQTMTTNLPSRAYDEDTIIVVLFKVRGFEGVSPVNGAVTAEEIISEETLRVDTDHLRDVNEALGDAEIAAETALVEGEEVTDEETEPTP